MLKYESAFSEGEVMDPIQVNVIAWIASLRPH